MTTLLQRARAYADMYRIRRQRHTPPLIEALNARYNFGVAEPEPDESVDLMVDDLAETIGGHPDVVSMEVEHGGTYGFVAAYSHSGALLARVDVDPDGTLTLIPDDTGAKP